MRSVSGRFVFVAWMAVTVMPSTSTCTSARMTSPTFDPSGSSEPSSVPLGWRAPAARHVQLPSGRELVSSISIRGIRPPNLAEPLPRRLGGPPRAYDLEDGRAGVVMRAAPDDALLAGYAVGDPDAAAAFIRRHQAKVCGLARAIVCDTSLAEDVAQEAFLRAWRHAPAYDARKGTVSTWLLTITRNLAVDAVRMRRSQPVDPDVFASLNMTAGGPDGSPALTAENQIEVGRVVAALDALNEGQRRALLLAAVCGRTAKEISETEGIPLGTAKTRIRSGLLKLRDSLKPEREGGGE
jgi:RNA polymerase sigma-70 factor (ECF subfamily)